MLRLIRRDDDFKSAFCVFLPTEFVARNELDCRSRRNYAQRTRESQPRNEQFSERYDSIRAETDTHVWSLDCETSFLDVQPTGVGSLLFGSLRQGAGEPVVGKY